MISDRHLIALATDLPIRVPDYLEKLVIARLVRVILDCPVRMFGMRLALMLQISSTKNTVVDLEEGMET